MIPVELSEAADADLDDILDYGIRAFGRDVAEAYLRLIDATLARLSMFPEMGAPRPDLRPGIRSVPVKEHRVYYRFDGNAIGVVRVLHKAMDEMQHL